MDVQLIINGFYLEKALDRPEWNKDYMEAVGRDKSKFGINHKKK